MRNMLQYTSSDDCLRIFILRRRDWSHNRDKLEDEEDKEDKETRRDNDLKKETSFRMDEEEEKEEDKEDYFDQSYPSYLTTGLFSRNVLITHYISMSI